MTAAAEFRFYEIHELELVYRPPDSVQRNGSKRYRCIANGSFVSGATPVAPLMLNGDLVSLGCALEKTAHRGGVAVMESGQIKLGRLKVGDHPKPDKDKTQKIVEDSFGGKVKHFMGGGAMLIEAVHNAADLGGAQHFDQGGVGIAAGQMRLTNHVAMAQRAGHTFLILALQTTGAALRSRLQGYDSAVLFDGGRQFWAHTPDFNLYVGPHPLAIGVKS